MVALGRKVYTFKIECLYYGWSLPPASRESKGTTKKVPLLKITFDTLVPT